MAWWLAYEELYGDMDKEYPIMKQKEKEKDVTILGGDTDDTITFTSDSVGAADTISIDFGSASPDTVNIGTPLPGGMGEDHIVFNVGGGMTAYDDPKYYAGFDGLSFNTKPQPNLKDGSNQKYQEDKGIADLKSYVASTYQGHYTNKDSDVQTLDLSLIHI